MNMIWSFDGKLSGKCRRKSEACVAKDTFHSIFDVQKDQMYTERDLSAVVSYTVQISIDTALLFPDFLHTDYYKDTSNTEHYRSVALTSHVGMARMIKYV